MTEAMVAEGILNVSAKLMYGVSGLAFGLSLILIPFYFYMYRHSSQHIRLLPLHVMLLMIAYAMLAFIGLIRLGSPPPPDSDSWWIYLFILASFIIWNLALVSIIFFLRHTKTGREQVRRHNVRKRIRLRKRNER